MEVSKLRFDIKEVVYLMVAATAYFTQLTILSNKIETQRTNSALKFQEFTFRIGILESKLNLANTSMAILPQQPNVPKRDEE
jgi:hypothetical protein